MTRETMKLLDKRLEEIAEEVGQEWSDGTWTLEEMQTVAFLSIALQLRRMNNLMEGIRREKNDE